MAFLHSLPAPHSREINDSNVAEKWSEWKEMWEHYSVASKVNKEEGDVQVAAFLTAIGPEARKVFKTWNLSATERQDIKGVIERFDNYCNPTKNIPFERYLFNSRQQEPGESFDRYVTALRQIADKCAFGAITPDDLLRDRIIFGIADNKVRERLLREPELNLSKTLDICRASEMSQAQIKTVSEFNSPNVHLLQENKKASEGKLSGGEPSPANQLRYPCRFCGRKHESKREACPAWGKTCVKCGKENHFARKCPLSSTSNKVALLEEESELPVFQVFKVSANQSPDSSLVTLKVLSGNFIRFEIDTGARCNVLPIHIYKKATGDFDLKHVTPAKSSIVSYDGGNIPVLGTVKLQVWRGSFTCLLLCRLVESKRCRPILGKSACEGMGVVEIKDSDAIRRPDTSGGHVFSVEDVMSSSRPLTKEQVIEMFPDVFDEGLGLLEGEYHIRLNDSAKPVQHAPRRGQVALRSKIKDTLEELHSAGVIEPVSKPTPWISSMLAVPKKNGKIRICLDPKDLNKAILRENYPMPTIEDIATRLHGAKVFSVLDAKNGFWHVKLDEESSHLTTFHTPFGRYRWCRMPFGISLAPEVFQRRMHELIEGLSGTEVVADDFVVAGFGDTLEEAFRDHNKNLVAFLQRCSASGVKLAMEKLQLCLEEVPLIGHYATKSGLKIHPEKVRAVLEMPRPTDVKSLLRFNGTVQYLAKFLPGLSDMAHPLRQLTRKDAEWVWSETQEKAWSDIKTAISQAPVLRFYSLQDEVTLQCDASDTGLGAALLQLQQPVSFASRALTQTETRYAQIEKELLAIVFACEKFDEYIFGRDAVHVETDHKPLEEIFKKSLCDAPARLQRMLLRLQRYNLEVKYKKGSLMFIADTLSRAYLGEMLPSVEVKSLELVDHTENLRVSPPRLTRIEQESALDPVCAKLRQVILEGWPGKVHECDPVLRPFFQFCDALIAQGNLVFREPRRFVPSSLRKEFMSLAHSSHIGLEGCLCRLRECMFWPRMSAQMKDFVGQCDVCLTHRDSQVQEPLLQHEVPPRPWAKIAADICFHSGRALLVVVDYFSNFIEVDSLSSETSKSVIRSLMATFSRFGVPDTLVTDNGPCFASTEFAKFVDQWNFQHVTSSPHYLQSNGKAENAVRTVERLFTKCRAAGVSEFQALLDWRNTPSEGMDTSPAQRLLGRRCKTLLPTSGFLLTPEFSLINDAAKLCARKDRQRRYFNRGKRVLSPVRTGETIRVSSPSGTWRPAECLREVAP